MTAAPVGVGSTPCRNCWRRLFRSKSEKTRDDDDLRIHESPSAGILCSTAAIRLAGIIHVDLERPTVEWASVPVSPKS